MKFQCAPICIPLIKYPKQRCDNCFCNNICKMYSCLICCAFCECNCFIFPGPQSQKYQRTSDKNIIVKYDHFINKYNQNVPFLVIQDQESKNKQQSIIYFHGNAQDIKSSIQFLLPIFDELKITIYSIQYPGYLNYNQYDNCFISDVIKSNSIDFFNYLTKPNLQSEQYEQKTYQKQNIYIMGRSIGTGPACYLASQVKFGNKLILISPFDSIYQMASSYTNCLLGLCVKNHFDSLQAMEKYKGQLCVVHGRQDQVINIDRGINLVNYYEKFMGKGKAKFTQPLIMTHNNFDIQKDIVGPIKDFFNKR